MVWNGHSISPRTSTQVAAAHPGCFEDPLTTAIGFGGVLEPAASSGRRAGASCGAARSDCLASPHARLRRTPPATGAADAFCTRQMAGFPREDHSTRGGSPSRQAFELRARREARREHRSASFERVVARTLISLAQASSRALGGQEKREFLDSWCAAGDCLPTSRRGMQASGFAAASARSRAAIIREAASLDRVDVDDILALSALTHEDPGRPCPGAGSVTSVSVSGGSLRKTLRSPRRRRLGLACGKAQSISFLSRRASGSHRSGELAQSTRVREGQRSKTSCARAGADRVGGLERSSGRAWIA